MCGIVGYIGHRDSREILVEGLKKLEYRGYDSAGIAVYDGKRLAVRKASGRLAALEAQLERLPVTGTVGIGHTRWATHGKPSDANSHPHTDAGQRISVVHNGIIENYMALKEELAAKGYGFASETDTEVIAHLISDLYEGDIVAAVRAAVARMRGAFGLGVLAEAEPDKLVAVRMHSPLVVGVGDGENFIASDIPAILAHTRDVYILNDGEMAVLTSDGVSLSDLDGGVIEREVYRVEWDLATAEKGGYEHFMLKEIYEQPRAYRDTMSPRMDGGRVDLADVGLRAEDVRGIRRVHIVACGTAYHSGLVGKMVIERLARIPVETDIASEYRYRDPIVTADTLVIVVSQSGETADTLAAMREAKRRGAKVLAITNVVGSSVAREADFVMMTMAAPEIAVASTKAYTTMLVAFYLLGLYLAQTLETMLEDEVAEVLAALQQLPGQAESLLAQADRVRDVAERLVSAEHLFFIGRGLDYASAVEGSLKLKEISYIHSEAYAAGELKHGTLALITEGMPVIALAAQEALLEKMLSNVVEVKARGARVLGIACEADGELAKTADEMLVVPRTHPLLTPALTSIPLQLLAYYVSLARGNDVDKPRNLAKSVTVE